MSEMKLWAAKDGDGKSSLYRSSRKPYVNQAGIYELSSSLVDFDHAVARIACQGVGSGECREIKTLDLLKSTVEYAPNPPTLKEAWKAYRARGIVYNEDTSYGQLIEALHREFPDE